MIKKVIVFIFLLLLVLAGLTYFKLASVGTFRTVDNRFEGRELARIGIVGAEDFALSQEDRFLIISSTDRASFPEFKSTDGLYLMEIDSLEKDPVWISKEFNKDFHPHGISMVALTDGSYDIYAINHYMENGTVQHTVEIFNWNGNELVHQITHRNAALFSPNDIVAIGEGKYYFTNDHGSKTSLGRTLEDYLGLKRSDVYFYDGNTYSMVADGISYANGINFDSQRNLLFVSSPPHFLVKAYDVQSNYSLNFIEDILCGSGVDNIEFGTDGALWIGSHPKLLEFTAYASGGQKYAPSEIITIDYRGKGDYTVKSVFESDGKDMSASSVAIPDGDRIFFGNVMDQHFLVLQQN